jgi:hypothetical protein
MKGSFSISVIPKRYLSAFGNGFAQVKIFYAIPLPPFSAAMNSAPKHPSLFLILCSHACLQLVSLGKVVLNTASPSAWVRYPRRTVGMPKSSIVASTIPKSHIYHGDKDAYEMKAKFASAKKNFNIGQTLS